jgi:hypothetical protein
LSTFSKGIIVTLLLAGGFNAPASQLQAQLKLANPPLLPRPIPDPSIQDRIEYEVKESKRIHFLRVLVIPENLTLHQLFIDDNDQTYHSPQPPYKYVQVLTEYEGTRPDYTDFFRAQLTDVFTLIFGLVDGVEQYGGAQQLVQMQGAAAAATTQFWKFSRQFNIHALGVGATQAQTQGDTGAEGYLFSAYAYNEIDPARPRTVERNVVEVLRGIKVRETTDQFTQTVLTIEST